MKSDKQVQGTNDSSIVSKVSMTNLGYYEDVYVKEMVVKCVRRAPLINRGYYLRAKAVEFAISEFLQRNKGQKIHLVSLGAGFDTTYFRLKASGRLENAVFVEVDFLDVALRKARILRSREILEEVVRGPDGPPLEIRDNNYLILDRPDYKLLGVSLAQLDVLEASLRAVGLEEEGTILFLAECVLSYISEKRTAKLIHFLSQSFVNSTFVLYEQMHPHDGFGKLMLSHFRKIGAPLLSLDKHPSAAHQISRFLSKGWRFAEAIDMNEFYFGVLPIEERQRVEALEVFDEYEEFHMKCGHYFLLVAQGGDPSAPEPIPYLPHRPTSSELTPPSPVIGRHLPSDLDEAGWRVHAHCCVAVNDVAGVRWLVRIGGYGRDPVRAKGHSRLRSLTLVPESGGQTVHVMPENEELLDCAIFRSTCPIESHPGSSSFLLFGGRVSPLCPSGDLVHLRIWSSEAGWAASCHSLGSTLPACGPGSRWRHSACTLRQNGRPVMLLCGGRSSEGRPLADAFLFDIETNSWRATAPLPCGGVASSVLTALSDSYALLSCGLDQHWRPRNQLWLFSASDETWRQLVCSSSSSVLAPRFCHTAHLLAAPDGATVVTLVGGVGGAAEGTEANVGLALLRVNAEAGAVDVLGEFPTDLFLDEPAMLFAHGSLLLTGSKVLVCGGGGNCFSFGTHLNERLTLLDLKPALQACGLSCN